MIQLDPTVETCDIPGLPPGRYGLYDPPYTAPWFYFYPYYGHYEYYLMYPGAGSGWKDYIVELAGNLARDYAIDGIFLDSYGVHNDHIVLNYNPLHERMLYGIVTWGLGLTLTANAE